MSASRIGVLLTNTGTPDAPTKKAVRRFLKEFLSDPRIVQLPRLIWLPILHGLVLNIRPHRSVKLYQQIWTPDGSPMRVMMQQLKNNLHVACSKQFSASVEIEIGMNYGLPSIQEGLENLQKKSVNQIILLPLFPQYSNTTSASSFDRITHALEKCSTSIPTYPIKYYAHQQDYIQALATSIRNTWKTQTQPEHLLISFHGIPKRYIKSGDPYQTQCEQTAALLAKELALPTDRFTLCYQSRFGYNPWLLPSTQTLFTELPQRGIRNIQVICPGFAIDCLETLEEIAIRGKTAFLKAGGQSFHYIPALNASPAHIELLIKLLQLQ